MNRMSPQDAAFLHIENDHVHMHIASCSIFEGPAPSYQELTDHVAGKLPLVPRYRQRVRFLPLDLGRPVWVDDPHFNLCYHVRHTALPRPGGVGQLRTLMGRVVSQQLDRAKPLWEMWFVEGLEDGRWALLNKVHHCMVDGISGTDLTAVVYDDSPEPSPPVPDIWRPEPEPSTVRLVGEALVERVSDPYEQMRTLRASLRAPARAMQTSWDVARGMASYAGIIRPAPATSLVGPIGPHRRWAWARTRLDDVKSVRSALGGTVNDVILATITKGFRDLLASRGELDRKPVIRSLVPVSVRRPHERGTYNNRVSAMFAELPVCVEDPVERLRSITAQMRDLKESKQAVAGQVLTELAGFWPPQLLALGTRAAARMPQRNVTTVTTNVPGPQRPMYVRGRQLLELFPFVPLGADMRIGCAIISYYGALNVGVTGDYDTTPDLEVLTDGVEQGMAELLKAADDGRQR
jgi:diacylglycerol O-acyltransferase / wax synthase